jgi:hypothetical protein
MKIYRLNKVSSTVLHQFAFVEGPESKKLLEDTAEKDLAYKMYLLRGESLRETWTPLYMAWSDEFNPKSAFKDIPRGDFSYTRVLIGVTQRVVDALGDVMDSKGSELETYGELLPLQGIDGNRYYLFNPPVLDVLDEENSYFTYLGNSDKVSEVYIYSFLSAKLENAWIFQIPQQAGTHFFVTEQCKQRMEETLSSAVSLG